MKETQYDVFISYSRKDYVDDHKNVIPGNEVSKIKEALTKAGITFWMDEKGIVPGEDYADKIVKHIKVCKIFVYISSVAANQSDWTKKEIACALMYKKYVIPLLLDDSPFNDSVILRIVDLDRIDYYVNPEFGLDKLVRSINTYLEEERATEKKKIAEEKRRQEELERQRRQQEEEKKRQEKIADIETKMSALEVQRTERKKAVLQKEQELKLAQIDLEECEANINKLQQKIHELREPQVAKEKAKQEKERIEAEERRKEEAQRQREAEERRRREEEARAKEKKFTIDGVEFKMIRVEGGSFMMGSPDDATIYDDEKPQHRVTLSDYYIGETQVTQELWAAVMGNNPAYFKGNNNPVECVSWDNCQEFIRKLNEKTGKAFRLPTEAEWEFAARGGKKCKGYKYAGSDTINEVAWYNDNSNASTHPVKLKKPNELDIYDMSGNVWEWCQDWFDSNYYENSPDATPQGPVSGSDRVLRGGSWINNATYGRTAYRSSNSPGNRNNNLGFRLAL